MTRFVAWLIRVPYQKFWTRFTPACPQTPCCSDYALDVITRHGWREGCTMALDRVMNCSIPEEK